jgi:predicted O-methyltransferase YrrM
MAWLQDPKARRYTLINRSCKIRPSLFEIFKKRIDLFLHGDRDGVGLNFLQKSTNGIFFNIKQLVQSEKELPSATLKFLESSKNLYEQIINQQKSVTNLRWNAKLQLFALLYSLIKSTSPRVVLETGVANGVTTNGIMRALDENNNSGALHSFDILPETKNAYKGSGHWNFHLLNNKRAYKQIVGIVSKLSKIDIWVHDSNHGYRWQRFEYLLALKSLNENGILISDDVEASLRGVSYPELILESIIFDSRKFIEIALK